MPGETADSTRPDDADTTDAERLSHDPCTCEPMVESAVYCPYCGEEVHGDDHRVDAEVLEVVCANTTMSTPRYCMGCGTQVEEYDWDSPDPERSVYHDATTGEWVEIDGGDESYRRMDAAQRLGCAESDLRPGYDHSGREPEDTEAAEQVLKDALGDDHESGGSTERGRLERRLAMKDQSDEFEEDENHSEVNCRFCGEDHLGELYESPPDGFYVRYFCTNEDRRGRRSFE